MDKWTRAQDLVEDVFGKRPDSPEMLVEYMIVMADMIIEAREISDINHKPNIPANLQN